MVVLCDGIDEVGRGRTYRRGHHGPCGGIKPKPGFPQVPTVVAAIGDDVDLFDTVLANISEIQQSRLTVEAEAEGIAQAIREDLIETIRAHKRIPRGNAVFPVRRVRPVHIDANDFTVDLVDALGIAARDMPGSNVVRLPTVTEGHIEESVRAKVHRPPVVIGLRFVQSHDFPAARHVHHV